MKENSIKNERSSVEEDIEILEEKMNKELDFLIENANKTEQLTAISIIAMKEPIILLFLSILSDYKRVLEMNEVLLKENEELKRIDKIVENITEEDIEKAIKEYNECEDEFKTKLSLKQFDINVAYNDYLEKLNEYKENSVPIQKIKDKIEKLNKKEKEELKGLKGQDRYFVKQIYQNKRIILQELIEEREDK